MKPTLRKGAFVLASAMVISSAAPATGYVYAAKNFTYAYQTGGIVDKLSMEQGDVIDLRFIGVSDYRNYSLSWTSSNPQVATVDRNGVVTAKENGTATITLHVGDGKAYTSEGVVVTVGNIPAMVVSLGTSKNNTFDKYTLESGNTLDLNFYGVTNWSTSLYSTQWSSSNPDVATVNNMGVVTPVASGTTNVTINITNKATGKSLSVIPVEITVPAAEVSREFTAHQISDTEVTLTFANTDITTADLEKGLSFHYYVGDIKIAYPIKISDLKNGVATLSAYVPFTDGTRYGFTYGDASAEFVGEIRNLFDGEGVMWQTAELGKVDQGGGGTVAMYIANLNIDTVDIGVPVLSMHAPFELISKQDLYEAHRAFSAFCK